MSITPSIIHVESPYLTRNVKEALRARRGEMMDSFLSTRTIEDVFYIKGCIAGLEEAIRVIEEMEKQDGAR